jgi:hypothetical protein
MAVNKVGLSSDRAIDTTNRWSPSIWDDCPVDEMKEDPARGVYLCYDFVKAPVLVTPTITTEAYYADGLKAFGSSGGTLLPGNILGGGGLIATETDDNEGIGLATVNLPFKLSTTSGKFWFEARLKTNTVTDTRHGFVVGLWAQQTLSATVPIAAAGTLADNNFVGFHRLEADGDQIDTVYKADGQTQVTVDGDAISTTAGVHTAAGSLAADTYIKLGMVFDPLDINGKNNLVFFANNLRLATDYTMASGSGTDFPNDVGMGLAFAVLNATGTTPGTSTIDWWRAAQLY